MIGNQKHSDAILRLAFWLLAIVSLPIHAPSQSVDELERTRDQWQKPQEIFDDLGVKPGWSVADVGAGSGFFTFALSKRVGEKGRVWALDINPAAIAFLKSQAQKQHLKNVFPILTRPDDPMLAASAIDLALIVETYHEFEHPMEMLSGLRRSLKDGALLCIIDVPRSPQQNRKHAIPKQSVIDQVQANGFVLDREVPLLLPGQFMLVFKKFNGGGISTVGNASATIPFD